MSFAAGRFSSRRSRSDASAPRREDNSITSAPRMARLVANAVDSGDSTMPSFAGANEGIG